MSTDSENGRIVSVAVPVPLRRAFDYVADTDIEPGTRVLIPFRNRKLVGIVLPNSPSTSTRSLKPILRALDEKPTISRLMLEFFLWASGYYHHPVGEVIQAALPPPLRKAVALHDPDTARYFSRNEDIPDDVAMAQLARAPKQKQLYRNLTSGQRMKLNELARLPELHDVGHLSSVIRNLVKRGLIIATDPPPGVIVPFDGTLNPEQHKALSRIEESAGRYCSHLLHGITGSGKTEIYLHSIESCLEAGKQALVLVPEISLTPQLVERFTNRFGNRVHCYHSGMNPAQRYRTWWKARNGTAGVVLGTRSAIFVPILNLGRIIVDEEHDLSYKQLDGFRYHARDMSIKRASLEEVPVILGSATPSMESMENVQTGKYRISRLRRRTGKASLPEIELIDLRKQPARDGLSTRLVEVLGQQLAKNKQTILYINRRGYAPVAECPQCQWRSSCDRCDAYMTYHKISDRLRCHHCGRTSRKPDHCPQCRSELFFRGAGTQRIEEALGRLFPDARVFRFDRDKLGTFRKLQHTLECINSGNADIVVGTRLISKGHDFPKVTLVGIINPDPGLYNVDFRAPEQLFQELVQVAGRAGRGKDSGRVLIQTSHPDNPYMEMVRHQQFDDFFRICREERRTAQVPPFSHMALWRAESRRPEAGLEFLELTRRQGKNLTVSMNLTSVQIMDPVSSPMERVDERYRAQLLVKSFSRGQLHRVLTPWTEWVEHASSGKRLRWSLDVDPMEMC